MSSQQNAGRSTSSRPICRVSNASASSHEATSIAAGCRRVLPARSSTLDSSVSSISSSSVRRGRSTSRTPPTGSRRSSKRRRGSLDSLDSSASISQPTHHRVFVPREQVTYCIEWGLREALCCHGCYLFATAAKLSIDNREDDTRMALALVNTSKNYPGQQKQCLQLWKKTEEQLTSKQLKKLRSDQLHFIENHAYDAPPPGVVPFPVVAPTPSPIPFVAPSPSPATIPEEAPLTDQPVPMMVAPLSTSRKCLGCFSLLP
jgi:hypothetical protein